jgi:phospholipase/carboxylesterase
MRKQMVIFLHGIGGSQQNFQRTKQSWQESLAGVDLISLNAPFPYENGSGFQWYSVQGINDENRQQRIITAREQLDTQLQQQFRQHDFIPGRDTLVLVGFSQGAIMVLDLVISNRLPLAGVVSFSGRLVAKQPLVPPLTNAALLIHGKSDSVIHWQQSAAAAERLRNAGIRVETFYPTDLSHKLSDAGKSVAGQFIRRLLAS